MKKLISFILSIAMILSLITAIPTRSSAESTADFEYEIDGKLIKITKYIGNNNSVEIPDNINGYRVTMISESAFQNNTKLRTVYIPATITRIGFGAFDGMTNLQRVMYRSNYRTWSNIIISGNNDVLYDDEKMVYNVGGELSYKIINYSAYIYDTNESVDPLIIPGDIDGYSVKGILDYAFEDCHEIKTYVIPDSVTTLGYACFEISNFEKIFIGNGVKTIETDSFDGVNDLSDVYYSGTQAQWDNINIKSGNDVLLNAAIHYFPDDGKTYTWTLDGTLKDDTISSIDIVNLEVPEDTKVPSNTAIVNTDRDLANSHCTWVESISWYNNTDKKWMEEGEVFELNKLYTAYIHLVCSFKYFFADPMPKDAVTVNGQHASFEYPPDSDHTKTISVSYPFKCKKLEKEISKVEISFDMPADGAAKGSVVPVVATEGVEMDYRWNLRLGSNTLDNTFEKFEADKYYVLEVYLHAKDGNKFQVYSRDNSDYADVWGYHKTKVSFNNKAIDTSATSQWNDKDKLYYMYAKYTFKVPYNPNDVSKVIDEVRFNGIAEPIVGEAFSNISYQTDKYRVKRTWYHLTSSSMSKMQDGDIFIRDNKYVVNINLYAINGFSFAYDPNGTILNDKNTVTGYINGKEVEVIDNYPGYEPHESICLSAQFGPLTGAEETPAPPDPNTPIQSLDPIIISTVKINGINPPVTGRKSSFDNEDNESYTVEYVEWYNFFDAAAITLGDEFTANRKYRLKVKLTAKEGYCFSTNYSGASNLEVLFDGENGEIESVKDQIDATTVYASFIYPETVDHNYVPVVTEPTCTEGGQTTYKCTDCDAYFIDYIVPALGHDWGEPVYTWKGDYSEVTATRTCKRDPSHIEKETEDAVLISEILPTYEKEGKKIYSSTEFYNTAFKAQTIEVTVPKLGSSGSNVTKDSGSSSTDAANSGMITLKGTKIKKLIAGKNMITVKWKKQKKQTTGYRIQYSTNKKFKKGNKTVTIKKNKTTKTTIKKLKSKKKYYFRIRTYKKVGKKKYYSKWSKAKSLLLK